jgi:bacterioferritin
MEKQGKFVADLSEIRRRAREHMESGAVTPGYKADSKEIVALLNEALATELVCVLRYRRHYFMAQGISAEPVAAEFLEHANEELDHADRLANRITQLGGAPDMNPSGLADRSASEYIEGTDLKNMIEEDLVAERIAVDTYREMIAFIGASDPTTRRLLEDILAVEEEHADDLSKLISRIHSDLRDIA